jgi:predicted extracellular nuclease
MSWRNVGGLAVTLLLLTSAAEAAPLMRITEWMYQGTQTINTLPNADEFIEFTNVDTVPINLNGWSFDDADRVPGAQSLSLFGTVAPGESVILTDISDVQFRQAWALPASVKVIGLNTNNLGRGDEINLYDNTSALVDRLTYDDSLGAGPRTRFNSGNPTSLAALGANTPNAWVLASNGDVYGSYAAVAPAVGDVANPGKFTLYQVPEPSSLVLLAIGAAFTMRRRRHT